MKYCCVKCGKTHDGKSHICKECSKNLVMPYTQDWWEKIIKEKDEQNKSLQTKLQQAKEGLEFYAKAKHFEEHSYYDIMLEWGEKARETLEIINKE